MDGSRFDALARQIGRLATRRGAVRWLSATVVALGLRPLPEQAEGRKRDCRLVGEACGTGAGKPGRCCHGAVCNEDQIGGGICSCPHNLQECSGLCVDIASNPLACGIDCVVCAADTDCCNGICCKAGGRCCGGSCTDLSADNGNCGGCGQECPAGLTCCDSRCRAFDDDPRHCGACNTRCPDRRICSNGQCVCQPGYRDCGDGICRNLKTDPLHCGVCGRVCGPNQVCRGGRCRCTPAFSATCAPSEPGRCGRLENRPCERSDECCGGNCITYGGQLRCWPCRGFPCTDDRQCCQNLTCEQSPGPAEFALFCGGCRGRHQTCSVNEQCCTTECTPDSPGSTCLSNRDGRCLSDFDCRDCFVNGNCAGACAGGRCRV